MKHNRIKTGKQSNVHESPEEGLSCLAGDVDLFLGSPDEELLFGPLRGGTPMLRPRSSDTPFVIES